MTVDPGRLRVLVEVANAGSIAAAADRMSFTPSALSQQLSKLEREVGCPLLHRGQGGVRLTEAGAALVRHGEVVLGELRAAEETVRALVGRRPERLAIGAFASAAKSMLPEALAAFRDDNPDVRLSLSDIEPPGGYRLVISGDLDLLITHRYPGVALPAADGLHRGVLLADPLLLVLPAGHPKAGNALPELADFAADDWISGGPGVANRTSLETLAGRAGLQPHIAYETQDYEVTVALVAVGLGIALVPASVLLRADGSGRVVRRLPGRQPARQLFVVHRRKPSSIVAAMVDVLRGVAENISFRADRMLPG